MVMLEKYTIFYHIFSNNTKTNKFMQYKNSAAPFLQQFSVWRFSVIQVMVSGFGI